jgi:hypothetical protein
MNASQMIQYLDAQQQAIETLIEQLDEVQVAFNAQFDEFKAWHDAKLRSLTEQISMHLDTVHPELRAAIEERLPEPRQRIEERRLKIREQYLPQRRQAADDLLRRAQNELAEMRRLNPELDSQEETLKGERADLETRLSELNDEIQHKSRGLGVVLNFFEITRADRERHRILGKLETIGGMLYDVRSRWERELEHAQQSQAEHQERWQLESIAVARLQSELDQLDDRGLRENLALRRAIRHMLDALDEQPAAGSNSELETGLQEMIELNRQTDDYHEGLASVGGMIGLLRGINSGIQAIRTSIDGLRREQQMHQAYLKPLDLSLPSGVETFHKQWPALAHQFADEKTIGTHPVDFSTSVKPLLEGPLSQDNIEAMFNDLGEMIKRATSAW